MITAGNPNLALPQNPARIAAGRLQTCALTTGGGVKCWGDNITGELGDSTDIIYSTTPLNVTGLANGVSAIAAGRSHTCGLTSDGTVRCWGANGRGQLGDGTLTDSHTQVAVDGLVAGVSLIGGGPAADHTCAALNTGGAKCWGRNNAGQLGDGTTIDRPAPVDVAGIGALRDLSTGGSHTCAVTVNGAARCWGRNRSHADFCWRQPYLLPDGGWRSAMLGRQPFWPAW
jgi:alpha-tubulin suppressor-like RCC1 family protein